ncbi:MutS-related protein [Massilia sp. BKSP1R2A-1]|uniref:MutS-related protein n=1 Tax=Massilia sp. BKSP1R2A-1 TaxID=3422595 RepID=UPI003D32946C
MIRSLLSDLLRPVTDFFKPEAEREPPTPFFTPEEISRLHCVTPDSRAALDAQTWQDLLLEPYEETLTRQTSIFGRQLLHRRLRAGLDDRETAALGERLRGLLDDAPRVDALMKALRPLRHAETEVAGLLFEGEAPSPPAWARFTWVLPLLLLLSLGLLLTQPLGWMATLAAVAPLMGLQIAWHRRVEAWNQVLNSLQALLAASTRLAALGGPLLEPFVAARAQNARLHQRLARPLLFRAFPPAESYFNWFAACNVRRFWRTMEAVHAARDFLRERYLEAATLEADVTLARHLRGLDHWCWAGRSAPRVLELEEGVHPLMDRPAALSVALDGRGAFISGQNASGKSTFLRMVGLNLVAARAFGFCYAKRAVLPAVPVRASMQNEDSLLGGESLYMSELRRARELLDASGAPGGICLIDEVFRGTNHLESVSSAAAVLESLASRDLVLVSSHNLVLARILAGKLEPFRIDTSGGAPALQPGVLREPNGIALLATQGFGPEIEGRAAEVARWLHGHLAEPAPEVH